MTEQAQRVGEVIERWLAGPSGDALVLERDSGAVVIRRRPRGGLVSIAEAARIAGCSTPTFRRRFLETKRIHREVSGRVSRAAVERIAALGG